MRLEVATIVMFESARMELEAADHQIRAVKRVPRLLTPRARSLRKTASWVSLTKGLHSLRTSLDTAFQRLIELDGGDESAKAPLPIASSQREYAVKCKRIDTPRNDTMSFLLSLANYQGGAGDKVYKLDFLDRVLREDESGQDISIEFAIYPPEAGWRKPLHLPLKSAFHYAFRWNETEPITLLQIRDAVESQLERFEKFVAKRPVAAKGNRQSNSTLFGHREAGQDFIRDIVREDLASGRYKNIVTRFPPEPNGYLHIGHAKSIGLNFGLVQEFPGHCNLRFDDTNPAKEEQEYIDAIERDVRWLGFDWGEHLHYASDYFDQLYVWGEDLIRAGKAYVDDQTQEEMRLTRGTLTEAGTESPYRNRSVEENLDLFRRMRAGEFPNGARVLRAKIDMGSGNINLRDPVLYRILHADHPRTGRSWCIYPSYDFAHGQSDSIEGVTHSICTLEFEDHRPLYDWCLENLPVPSRPHQYEFARLNITHTILSKRVLTELVREGYVSGWDDPRMPTLAGLRRRGVPPAAIRDFVKQIGVAKANSTVDVAMFEHFVREQLNKTASRRMAVIRPLKVIIENYPNDREEEIQVPNHPEDVNAGKRGVAFGRELFIERDDFMETPAADFFRLSPGAEVRLRYAYFMTCREVVKDAAGEIVELRCTYDPATKGGNAPDGRKVKATMHWVSAADSIAAEVRIYNQLFAKPNPDAANFAADLNPQSLEVLVDARVEPALAGDNSDDAVQFERQGYFCRDRDSRPGRLVFNRTVGLRDTWAKVSGG